ncbi:MAG: PAC2 family protein [Candidatus Bathyarchaeia archaeon]
MAVEYLVEGLRASLFAELYSPYFPVIYYTKPSYAPHPSLPGSGGVKLVKSGLDLPAVRFYSHNNPDLLITVGYHANFQGQFEVAEKALDLFKEFEVKRIFILAGYGYKGKDVCCAATDLNLIEEMKSHGIDVGYIGPFYGFSGLVFGFAKLRGIEGICLFGRSEPNIEDPEHPDPAAARAVVRCLEVILGLKLHTTEN